MRSGEAPTAEASTIQSLLSRKWTRGRPVPTGVLSVLTLFFWGFWLYLVLPLVSLLLWAFGVRFFFHEMANGGVEGLRASLVAYSSILLVLVGVLALWIAWNVVRYGGSRDRRTAKRPEVTDLEVRQAFHLDDGLLDTMRTGRLVRIDLDAEDCVVMIGAATLTPSAPEAPPPQRVPPRSQQPA
jgi:poly-beta-1,6-N-acetyl-D-glucosamine biosynthesis protein PgaD